MKTTLNTQLNQVDICFVIDTTGSMSSFIQAAKQHLLNMISTLGAINGLDWQVGLVEYRDHPPQDRSFVVKTYALTKDLAKMQKSIQALKADGGGDQAEAVYDGLAAACQQMSWRDHSCRFAILVGDAPPHGFQLEEINELNVINKVKNVGDSWPELCPCGLTGRSVAALAEEKRVTLYAISMTNCKFTLGAFKEVANGTGGHCSQSSKIDEVLKEINSVLDSEFQNILFDKLVLEQVDKTKEINVQEIADSLASPRLQVVSAIGRLGRRGFLDKYAVKKDKKPTEKELFVDHKEPVFLLTSLVNSFFNWSK